MSDDADTVKKWWRQLFAGDDEVTPEERRAASRGLDRVLDRASRQVRLAMIDDEELACALERADAALEELVEERGVPRVETPCTDFPSASVTAEEEMWRVRNEGLSDVEERRRRTQDRLQQEDDPWDEDATPCTDPVPFEDDWWT